MISRPISWFLLQAVKGLIASCAVTGILLAQPSLRITSPADGATVHPGESLTVMDDASPPEGTFQMVLVVGFTPIGNSKEALGAPPYRFTMQIPNGIRPGRYTLTATGSMLPGHPVASDPVMSDPITIFVERADSPISLRVYPPTLDFTMDQKRYMQVTGLYADKTTADLSHSKRINYVSSAPDVATVQAQGIVSPVARGTGKITITYGDVKVEVPLKVRESRR